jgi:adenine phosphoribosyltransferase
MDLKSMVRDIPDFPQKGILFRDISPILKDPEAMNYIAKAMVSSVNLASIDYFAGIESRGFILAALLAASHRRGFLPIRKAGKLPPPVVAQKYSLEYGQAAIELNPGKGRVMIIDDVLATGGTLQASINLCEAAGYKVENVGVLINISILNQMKFRNKEVISLIRY